MSIATVLAAASALREVNDQLNAKQDRKSQLQTELAQVNAEINTLQAERAQRVATLKTEAGTI